MNQPQRPDLRPLRIQLAWLIGSILVAVIGLLALTFYLYQRFTEGVTVAP